MERITNIDELLKFMEKNFDKLTDSQFEKVLNATLTIYPLEKPKSLDEALDMISHYGNIPLEIRPLFPNITEFDEN